MNNMCWQSCLFSFEAFLYHLRRLVHVFIVILHLHICHIYIVLLDIFFHWKDHCHCFCLTLIGREVFSIRMCVCWQSIFTHFLICVVDSVETVYEWWMYLNVFAGMFWWWRIKWKKLFITSVFSTRSIWNEMYFFSNFLLFCNK